jgi:uncharacterized repeat protein (TIGR03803 family)
LYLPQTLAILNKEAGGHMQRRLNFAFFVIALAMCASPALAKKTVNVIHSFGETATDPSPPDGELIADKNGNLYGTTALGGTYSWGTVFKAGPDGETTTLYSFDYTTTGGEPSGPLIADKNGNLYGVALIGGPNSQGVLFQLVLNGSSFSETIIYSFCKDENCTDGASPNPNIAMGPKGELYVVMGSGGANGQGTVLRFDPPRKNKPVWKKTTLYDFCSEQGCPDGKFPASGILLARDGFLYGTAEYSDQSGTLYRLSPQGGGFQVLHAFSHDGIDGETPYTGLREDSAGILYGTEANGGLYGCGIAYSFDTVSLTYSKVHDFCSGANDHWWPSDRVLIVEKDSSKTLYSVAVGGAGNEHGLMYSLSPPAHAGDPWATKVLYTFCAKVNCADGEVPIGPPIKSGANLFGVTEWGGDFAKGTAYRYGSP